MAKEKVVKIKIETDSTPVKNLKTELRESLELAQKLATAEVVDQEALQAAIQRTAELKDAIADVNEQVDQFASGSKFEQATNSLGQVGSAIKAMDFDKAKERAKAFAQTAKAITFKDATKSLVDMGKTFVQVGKAILSNPLFLLAAIIVGVVVAVYKLLDSLGLIQKALDIVMKPIQYLIDLFYKLTDAIGLTNVEAQKAADETANAYEKSAKSIAKSNEETLQGLDKQIKLAQLAGKDTTELERERRKQIEETARAEAKANKARFEAALINRDLTKEEIADLKEKARVSRLAYQQTVNDTEVFEAQLAKTKKDNKDKDAKATDDANKKASDKRKSDWEKRKAEEEKAEQDRIAKEKQYASDRLSAKRLQEDLDLELMKEGVDKEVALNKLKYDRLIEDTKTNEKLTAEERIAMIEVYQSLVAQKEIEINNASNKIINDAKIQAQTELNALLFDLNSDAYQKEIAQVTETTQAKIDALRTQLEEGYITKEEFDNAEIELAKNKADKILEIEKDNEEAIRAEKLATVAANIATAEKYANSINDLSNTIFEIGNELGKSTLR